MLLEGIEVAVTVQQGVAVQQAEACDETVDGFADGITANPEMTVVLRGSDCEFLTPGVEDSESGEFAPHAPEVGLLPDALQHLAENEVGQAEALSFDLAVQPIGVRIYRSAKVVDPDSGVDDGHAVALLLRSAQPGLVQIALPADFAAKTADGHLRMSFHEETQSGVNGGFLGRGADRAHCLPDQLLVDFDVCPHGLSLMCKNTPFMCMKRRPNGGFVRLECLKWMVCGLALLMAAPAIAAQSAVESGWTVRPEWVRAHEEFLASDAMQGRGSATHDEEVTATYVASEFLGYGLKTAPGMTSLIQRAAVVQPVLDGHATIRAGSATLAEGSDFHLMMATGQPVSGPLLRVQAKEIAQAKVTRGV